jgi:hypothetical protein
MIDHCGDGCPWSGCQGCAYQGGVDPTKGANSLVVWENGGGKDGRSPAPTDDLPEPPLIAYEAPKEGLPTW